MYNNICVVLALCIYMYIYQCLEQPHTHTQGQRDILKNTIDKLMESQICASNPQSDIKKKLQRKQKKK